MAVAQSKITTQGQISVPAEVRRLLGVGPGSVLEWVEMDGQVIVRKAGRLGWDDVRKTLFPDGPPRARTLDELKEGRRLHARRRHEGR